MVKYEDNRWEIHRSGWVSRDCPMKGVISCCSQRLHAVDIPGQNPIRAVGRVGRYKGG